MINVVDINRKGDEHRTTIHPTLQALNDANLICNLWISIDSTSYTNLKGNRNFEVNLVNVRGTWIYRWITSTIITTFILFKSIVRSTDVFFLSASPLQNLLISIFSIFTKGRCAYTIFLHGELSYLVNPQGFGQKIGKFFLSLSLQKSAPFKVRQVTMAYPIYIQLFKLFGNSRLTNLELPTEDRDINPKVGNSSKLRIGSFGVHCADKNSHYIYELAKKLSHFDGIIEIVTIGIAHKDFCYGQDPFVAHLCKGTTKGELIDRYTFINQVKLLDMALIFYGESPKYKFISSGVFNDCINYAIPVACLQSDYIAFYMSEYGELGLMGNDLDQLAQGIASVASDKQKLEIYKNNILKLNRAVRYSNFKRSIYSLINEIRTES